MIVGPVNKRKKRRRRDVRISYRRGSFLVESQSFNFPISVPLTKNKQNEKYRLGKEQTTGKEGRPIKDRENKKGRYRAQVVKNLKNHVPFPNSKETGRKRTRGCFDAIGKETVQDGR